MGESQDRSEDVPREGQKERGAQRGGNISLVETRSDKHLGEEEKTERLKGP